MTTKYLRKLFRLTQKELADSFRIPIRTVEGWELRECMPEYVYYMMKTVLWETFFRLQAINNVDIDISNGLDLKYSDEYKELLIDILK